VIFTLLRSVSARRGKPQNNELLLKSNGGSVVRVGGTAAAVPGMVAVTTAHATRVMARLHVRRRPITVQSYPITTFLEIVGGLVVVMAIITTLLALAQVSAMPPIWMAFSLDAVIGAICALAWWTS
jgi:hypothetical protein